MPYGGQAHVSTWEMQSSTGHQVGRLFFHLALVVLLLFFFQRNQKCTFNVNSSHFKIWVTKFLKCFSALWAKKSLWAIRSPRSGAGQLVWTVEGWDCLQALQEEAGGWVTGRSRKVAVSLSDFKTHFLYFLILLQWSLLFILKKAWDIIYIASNSSI